MLIPPEAKMSLIRVVTYASVVTKMHSGSTLDPWLLAHCYHLELRGHKNNHVDIISPFFDHPPTSVDIFYVLNVDKFGKF